MRWRPLRQGERQLALVWSFSSVVILALGPLWARFAPLLPRCTFRALTGLPCPTCGSTRALLALAGGHPVEAFLWNPLVVALAAAFAAGGLVAPLWAALGAPLPVPSRRAWKVIRLGAVLLVVANWAWLAVRLR